MIKSVEMVADALNIKEVKLIRNQPYKRTVCYSSFLNILTIKV